MNTALMEAYEALNVIYVKRRDFDPQAEKLEGIMDMLWRSMDKDEIDILNARYAK